MAMGSAADHQQSTQPEIILHIGTHKTGTTSIQRYLGRNRDALKALGIWYPRYPELIPDQDDHYAHLDFARSLDRTIKNPRFSPAEVERLAESIVEQHQAYTTTIISAEPFWRVGLGSRHTAQAWDRKDAILDRVRTLFQGANVRVLAILRNQPDFIESLYSEVLLSTGYSHDIKQFMEDYQHYFEYSKQLDSWGKYFPVRVIGFSDLIAQPDLAQGFVSQITGIREEDLPAACDRRWNSTHPVPCVAMKRYLNGIKELSSKSRTHLYHRYKRFYLRRFSSCLEQEPNLKRAFDGKKKRWLSRAQIGAINQRFIQENQEIQAEYNCRFSTDDSNLKTSDSKLKSWEEQFVLGWMLKNLPPSQEWFNPADSSLS